MLVRGTGFVAMVSLFYVSSLKAGKQYDYFYEYELEEAFSLASGKEIRIQTDDAQLHIVGSDCDEVTLVAHRSLNIKTEKMRDRYEFRLDITQTENGLEIVEVERTGVRNFFSSNGKYTIDLKVPLDSSLVIREKDGIVQLDNLVSGIDVKIDDGSLLISNSIGDVSIVCGDCSLSGNSNDFQSFSVKADHTDIELSR